VKGFSLSDVGALLAATLVSGCATITALPANDVVKTVGGREVVESVTVENTGWYFLGFLPVATGNPERPNEVSSRWFRDTLRLEGQMAMLEKESRRVGARAVANLFTSESDEAILFFLFLRQTLHTSAVLVR